MVVRLAFERTCSDAMKYIVQTLSGPYVHTEMIVVDDSADKRAYSAYMSDTFSSTPERDFAFSDLTHDFLHVETTPAESKRVWDTCEVCTITKIPYNYSDMVLCVVPLRSPTERDIFTCRTLYCSQAMVLILRACLDKTHPLQAPLAAINSRVVTPTQLFRALEPFCEKVGRRSV